jgi:ABC-type nickel/cobalt efflux system permease component RcnA
MIRNKAMQLIACVRNYLAHYKQTWLPYGAILLVLAGVWYGWETIPTQSQQTIRETKNHDDSSPPVFDARQGEADQQSNGGTLVCSTAAGRRKKPLGDMFASVLPKKDAAVEELQQEKMIDAAHIKKHSVTTEQQPRKASLSVPTVCGTICTEQGRVVVLQSQQLTRSCQTGETFAGWYIAYINSQAIGLVNQGELIEINI